MKRFQCIYFVLFFGFLLGLHNGYITLWNDGSEEPLEVFPYHVQMLPQADQESLKNGIQIATEHDLQKLLEDYLS